MSMLKVKPHPMTHHPLPQGFTWEKQVGVIIWVSWSAMTVICLLLALPLLAVCVGQVTFSL